MFCETLWWTGDTYDEVVPPTIRLWENLSLAEKRFYTIYACVNYPEVFGSNYGRYALWLTIHNVVDYHIRDQFSAGGREEMLLSSGETVMFPAVYRRIKENADLFFRRLAQEDTTVLDDSSEINIGIINKRFMEWADRVSKHSPVGYDLSMDALKTYFWGNGGGYSPWWRDVK